MVVCLITGAGRGLGLGFAQNLSSKGHKIFATCRSITADLGKVNLNGGSIIEGVDFSTSTNDYCTPILNKIKSENVDILILNAGILETDDLSSDDSTLFANMKKQFEVNTVAPLKVTKALLHSNLKEGSKIFLISSLMGSIDDNGSGGMYGYRVSKCGLNMVGKSLSVDLKPKGIVVQILSPGHVATDMTSRWGGGISVEESVKGMVNRIETATMENTGLFMHQNDEEGKKGVLMW